MTGDALRARRNRLRNACIGSVVGLALAPAFAQSPAPATNEVDAAALRTSQAAIGHRTADYPFVDGHGRAFRLGQFHGKPVVLSMVFTNCYSVCSGLTLRLREAVRVARETLGQKSFTVVTVGFDTAHDTPVRMLAYGRERGIDDPDWYFASADARTIQHLSDDVGFRFTPSPAGFDHVAQVTLLDRDGTVVRQLYDPEFQPPALVEPLRELTLGRGLERLSVSDLITRVQLYCSVYDPVSGRYRIDYSMFAAALPALLVLCIGAIAIVAAGRNRH
jgi:protein SCO1